MGCKKLYFLCCECKWRKDNSVKKLFDIFVWDNFMKYIFRHRHRYIDRTGCIGSLYARSAWGPAVWEGSNKLTITSTTITGAEVTTSAVSRHLNNRNAWWALFMLFIGELLIVVFCSLMTWVKKEAEFFLNSHISVNRNDCKVIARTFKLFV